LIIHSTIDEILPYKLSQKLASMIDDCAFVELNEIGHVGMFKTKKTFEIIQKFSSN